MSSKAVISLSTGLEDAERVTVALLVAVGAAEAEKSAWTDVPETTWRPSLQG